MLTTDFTRTLTTSQSPEQVFQTVLNVRSWWSGYFAESFEGISTELNEEFIFHAGEGAHYSKQKLIELVPNKKVVWLVTESKLSFLEKQDEWTGTKIIFEISSEGDQTNVKFTHEGLTPASECFDNCTPA